MTDTGKNMAAMFEECYVNSDMRVYSNMRERRILRLASNARTEVHAPLQSLSLQEVGRTYIHEDGSVKKKIRHPFPKAPASSETIRQVSRSGRNLPGGELPVEAAQAGIKEEYGLEYPLDRFIPLTPQIPHIYDPYSSSAFARTISMVISWIFRLEIYGIWEWVDPKITIEGNILTIRDGLVLIHNEWRTPQMGWLRQTV